MCGKCFDERDLRSLSQKESTDIDHRWVFFPEVEVSRFGSLVVKVETERV